MLGLDGKATYLIANGAELVRIEGNVGKAKFCPKVKGPW
jgi:hypothetical protein